MFVENIEDLPESMRGDFVESERDGKKGYQHKDTIALANAMKHAKAEREQLKEKLQKEGLFDPVHKKPIPRFPQTVAVVLSKIKPDHASRVLTALPEDFALECVQRMLRMEPVQREILDKILAVASGEKTRSERLGLGDNEFVPWQIGAVM